MESVLIRADVLDFPPLPPGRAAEVRLHHRPDGQGGRGRLRQSAGTPLDNLGISTKGIVKDPSVFTTLDATGNREFSFARNSGADTCLHAEELDTALLDDCKVFHFGTLSLTGEPARSATQAAVAYAKEHGKLTSFDPNLRKPLWPTEEAAKEQIEWGLHQADIVKISDEEIEFLWGISPEEGAQKLFAEYDVKLVYATLGPKGCHFANPQSCGGINSVVPEEQVRAILHD